jgi:RNA polymerase II-associated protein 2
MASSPDPRHLEIALQHAHALQHRKDLQAGIDAALETLIDFPPTRGSTPQAPAKSDLAALSALLRPFCPPDFDSLIEERRCADRCGYVLCPLPPRKSKRQSTYRLLHSQKGGPLKAVPRALVESWCSQECARRAAFLKMHILKEPAWLRKEDDVPNLVILTGSGDELAETPLPSVEQPPAATPSNSGLSSQPATITPVVVERYPSTTKPPSTSIKYDHNAVEGYSTKLSSADKES